MTGTDIFNRALDLCALRGANDSLPGDVEDLRARSLGLLNVLSGELRPLQERLLRRKQPVRELHSLDETVDLCEGICAGVLPYALAVLLIGQEDPELCALLNAHAREAKEQLLRDGASRRHAILEVYG